MVSQQAEVIMYKYKGFDNQVQGEWLSLEYPGILCGPYCLEIVFDQPHIGRKSWVSWFTLYTQNILVVGGASLPGYPAIVIM